MLGSTGTTRPGFAGFASSQRAVPATALLTMVLWPFAEESLGVLLPKMFCAPTCAQPSKSPIRAERESDHLDDVEHDLDS